MTNSITKESNVQIKRDLLKRTHSKQHGIRDDDDQEEDENQEKIVNMCFVVIENQVNSNEIYSYDELSTSSDEIFEEFEKLALKYSIEK